MKSTRRAFAIILSLMLLFTNGSLSALAEAVLTLPTALEIIDEEAFYGDTSIDKVVLPENVKEIRARAFADSTLSEINLPDSLTSIDETAFDRPEKVEVIANKGTYAYEWAVGNGYTVSDGIPETPADEFKFNSSTGRITRYTGNREKVRIPSVIGDVKVTSIGSRAFSSNLDITTIIIPDSIKEIGDYAFINCSNLKSVESPIVWETYSDWDVEQRPFLGCTLKRFIVTGQSKSIPAYTFNYPEYASLEQIILPETITTIGESAFHGCQALENIHLPDGITRMSSGAFSGCSNLRSVNYPKNWEKTVSDWEDDCYSPFIDCEKLTNIVVPEGVTEIPEYAFKQMTSLKSIELPSTLITIGNYAFYCSDLTSIILPQSLKTIGACAFGNNSKLTSIIIPDSIIEMGDYAFINCNNLRSVESPIVWETYSDWDVEQRPFLGCTLKEFTVTGKPKSIPSCTFNYPEYANLEQIILPETITSIGESAFHGCQALESIHLPDSIMRMHSGAFSGCSNLSSINFPKSWKSVDDWEEANYYSPFIDCEKLTNIVVPEGVTEIPEYAFNQMTSLKNIELPSTLTTIGYCAFSYNSRIKSIVIPDSVKYIGDSAFWGCTGLKHVETPIAWYTGNEYDGDCDADRPFYGCSLKEFIVSGNPTSIPYFAFGPSEYDDLETVVLPDSITSIEELAFFGCSKITSMTFGSDTGALRFPDGFKTIGREAFCGCAGLKSVVFPESLTSIDDYAFSGCTGITGALVIPAGVSLGDWAFDGCLGIEYIESPIAGWEEGTPFYDCNMKVFKLTGKRTWINDYEFAHAGFEHVETIILPDTIRGIGISAFENCISLKHINIGESVSYISEDAFKGHSDELTIYGKAGSYAENYANENGIAFSTEVMPLLTVTLSGKVITKEALPISGVTVTLWQDGYTNGTPITVSTDENGVWSYTNAKSGHDYLIMFEKAGYVFSKNSFTVSVGGSATAVQNIIGGISEDEAIAAVVSVIPSTTTTFKDTTMSFSVTAHNASELQLIADDIWAFEYPANETGATQVERAFSLAGERSITFRARYADGAWSEPSEPVIIQVIEPGSASDPVFTGIGADTIFLTDKHTVSWSLPMSSDEIDHYSVSLYRLTNDDAIVVGDATRNNGKNTSFCLEGGLPCSGRYKLRVEAVAAGATEGSGNNGIGEVVFGYRTVPDFETISIESDGLPSTAVTVNWNAPVWTESISQKPDRYIIWLYGPGVENYSKAFEVGGNLTSFVLPAENFSVGGTYQIAVYGILGDGENWQQQQAGGVNLFNKSSPEITITTPTGPYLGNDTLYAQGTAGGGIKYVKAQLEVNGGPEVTPLVGPYGEQVDSIICEVDAATGSFEIKLEPAVTMSESNTNAIAIYGYPSYEAAETGTGYVAGNYIILKIYGSLVYSYAISSSEKTTYGYTWRYTGESLSVEVDGNKAIETLSVTADGDTINMASSTDTANYHRMMKSDSFSFATAGLHSVAIDVDGKKKYFNVYAVKGCTSYNMYTTAESTTCYSLPGCGSSLCTLEYNSLVKVLGTYDNTWLLVNANGIIGFVDIDSINANRDDSIIWDISIVEGNNPTVTITAKNYSTHVGKQYELYIAKDKPDTAYTYSPTIMYTVTANQVDNVHRLTVGNDLSLESGHIYYLGIKQKGGGQPDKLVPLNYGIQGKIIKPYTGEQVDLFSSGSMEVSFGNYPGARYYIIELLIEGRTVYEKMIESSKTGLYTITHEIELGDVGIMSDEYMHVSRSGTVKVRAIIE